MLPKTNQRGMDFNQFTKTLGEIYKTTVEHVYDKTGISEDPANIVLGSPATKSKAKKLGVS